MGSRGRGRPRHTVGGYLVGEDSAEPTRDDGRPGCAGAQRRSAHSRTVGCVAQFAGWAWRTGWALANRRAREPAGLDNRGGLDNAVGSTTGMGSTTGVGSTTGWTWRTGWAWQTG